MSSTAVTDGAEEYKKNLTRLQDIAETVNLALGVCCGPVGISRMAVAVIRSGKAYELTGILPWILNKGLKNNIHDKERVVSFAISAPVLHESLKPLLPEILNEFTYSSKTAASFLSPALAIAKHGDEDMKFMALPFFHDALWGTSWSPHNFGNLACAYLDMGGDPENLVTHVESILESQQDDPEDAIYQQIKEVKRAKHLCCGGFIKFLNHPHTKESAELTRLLNPFAGHIITDNRKVRFPEHVAVLASIQGSCPAGIAWELHAKPAKYFPVAGVASYEQDFLQGFWPKYIVTVAAGLFSGMAQSGRGEEISKPAAEAVDRLRSAFGDHIRDHKRPGAGMPYASENQTLGL